MKLKTITITDFRHFTSLTVKNLPETIRLIVLVGPNGCGKSSFIEALYVWYLHTSIKNRIWDQEYHLKRGASSTQQYFNERVVVATHDERPVDYKKMVYVRSAYRNEPQFRARRLDPLTDPTEEVRINRLIDNDAAVAKNYARLVAQTIEDVFVETNTPMSTVQLREKILGDIRVAVKCLFPELHLDSLANPLRDGTFRFSKGISKGYSYMNLSGGEKAAFDLILDFIIAVRTYDNTVFCIDEPEAHMNARLQSRLLKVLYEIIPSNCQFIVATHSIGMMRQAQEIEKQNPGSVSFLDFSDLSFDSPQTIEPAKPTRKFWKKAYDVALDDLAKLVAPERVVICEGTAETNRPVTNHSHDARCYGRIFEDEFPETQFVSAGDVKQVLTDRLGLATTLERLIEGIEIVRVIDRDARSPDGVDGLKSKGFRVLSRRNLESYLFDDEVLQELAKSVDKPEKADELVSAKRTLLENRKTAYPEDAPDDLKPASGEIYNACKRILELTNPGNDTKEFARDTLSRVVQHARHVYSDLKRDIFGVT